jgi:hypothetical protein
MMMQRHHDIVLGAARTIAAVTQRALGLSRNGVVVGRGLPHGESVDVASQWCGQQKINKQVPVITVIFESFPIDSWND